MLNDFVPSLIRTWVPLAVGAVLTWLAANLGIVIDDGTSTSVTAFAVLVVSGVYYTAARLVEHAWPALGRFLVSLGLVAAPTYAVKTVLPPNDQTERPYRG